MRPASPGRGTARGSADVSSKMDCGPTGQSRSCGERWVQPDKVTEKFARKERRRGAAPDPTRRTQSEPGVRSSGRVAVRTTTTDPRQQPPNAQRPRRALSRLPSPPPPRGLPPGNGRGTGALAECLVDHAPTLASGAPPPPLQG
eukprot:354777-Chlamydomonas_euryale.AAC.6